MTAPYGDNDLAYCLQDMGVPVVAGGVASFGAFDLHDTIVVEDAQRGQVHAHVPSVVVQVSAFSDAALAIDAAITVDGVNYRVREHEALNDGALLKLFLRKA